MILKKLIIFIINCSVFSYVFSNTNNNISVSPYDTIRYHEAFDQEKIYKKYKKLMYELGCADNIFVDNSLTFFKKRNTKNLDFILDELMFLELEKYQKECLRQLNYARFMALSEPGIESGMYISLMALGALLTIWIMGKDSTGGSYSGYSAIFGAAYELSGIGKSLYNLLYLPNNSLELLENYFAKNKCFIPKILWSKIINAFIDARQSDSLKEKSINFLKFALGFTMYKPQLKPFLHTTESIIELKHELNRRIDKFFSAYNINYATNDLIYIKINISKFIDTLIDRQSKSSRYIYLHGLGGIGKTHFVQTLSSWIEELLPGMIYYQDLIINTMSELEGDTEKPGAFLKVLRSQIMNNKIGSIVMLDEATWLNDKDMVSSAKRIFNGDRTRLSTAYFGADIDGSAVTLDMPPMLIFVASNDQLDDQALASRFDIVNYPTPSIEMLINYGYTIAQSSKILHEANCEVSYEIIADWVKTIPSKNLNFRYIAGNIEGYCLHKILENN